MTYSVFSGTLNPTQSIKQESEVTLALMGLRFKKYIELREN